MTKTSTDVQWTLNTDKACAVVVRVKLSLHAIKTYRGSRGIAPIILNLGTRWKSEDSGNRSPTLRNTKFEIRQEIVSDIRLNIKCNLIIKLYLF
jgi:hypothetical protein